MLKQAEEAIMSPCSFGLFLYCTSNGGWTLEYYSEEGLKRYLRFKAGAYTCFHSLVQRERDKYADAAHN